MSRILIIAYGNPMRGDDGVAWRAAGELATSLARKGVEILTLQQLAPELAETVSHQDAVIFVDAAAPALRRKPGEICCEEVKEPLRESAFSHQLSPHAIAALCRKLYNASPRAFLVTMTGQEFDHPESLSPPVVAALPAFIQRIEALVEALQS